MLNLSEKSDSIDKLSVENSLLIYEGKYDKEQIITSIVIPTYKRSALLFETVRSCEKIYNKSEFEIIIVFNARQESAEIVGYIKEKRISNVRVYENKENIGMFQNWNQGALLAAGKWVSIMHDDDMYEAAFFDLVNPLLVNAPSNTAYINFNGKIITDEKYVDLRQETVTKIALKKAKLIDIKILGVSPFFATTCGTLIKREILLKMGGFDADTYPSGDVLFPIKLLNNGYSCFICSKKINYYRKQMNASLKKDVMDMFIYYYGELQNEIYEKGKTTWFYFLFKKCLYFKAVWHVFMQADSCGIILDSPRPDSSIQRTLKYKIMDAIQRVYWKLKWNQLKVWR
ncbi:glycosyltransferase [Mediterraneibacter gnavus]|uniref:glycosyltransferase family 2 protein n=1 Tax=Mediterraneibacter gnavus TaxID=33038 RepID=UPI000E4F150F|nr:glycosyltransferase [Mediterraneibacter gnavus]RHE74639.1 glycosyltransferase [Mediterraneibacter gnavus]